MMHAAGMLRGTRSVYLLLLLIPLIGLSRSIPIQLLPSIPGYIPVYIRHGDQPLEEINPDLAEAFHETQNLRAIAPADDHSVSFTPKDDFDSKYLEKSKSRNSIYPLDGKKIQEDNASIGKTQSNDEHKVPIIDEKKSRTTKEPTDVEKDEPKPNDLSAPSYGDFKSEIPHKNEEHVPYPGLNFIPVSIIHDSSADEPVARRLPKQISNQSTTVTTSKDKVTAVPGSADANIDVNPPIKVQRPMGILSNVHKLSAQISTTEASTKSGNA